ncbi:acyl carrier protein [Streptomyces hesseae]|uniref:Acyl carrier protein n=1 Tax=Streptomyces hesseae TaxID=3075519 RepID=A0ABU2SFS7_9ACTN|nr:acyl carrier protein [Streptomyces sp. DSM 40473]MDT0447834.1 acyl carrier protein [Streptomyces sp. DSM 40473]
MNPAFDRIADVLTGKFEVPAELVVPGATLGDLNIDSLAAVELHLTLQEHWDISLDESAFTPDLALDDLVVTVSALLDEGAADV